VADPQNCPECGNAHLAIRTDIYKDGREFVYCDCCGCLADRRVWDRIVPKDSAIYSAIVARYERDRTAGVKASDGKCLG
jgi:transcription elongation factor Elf1